MVGGETDEGFVGDSDGGWRDLTSVETRSPPEGGCDAPVPVDNGCDGGDRDRRRDPGAVGGGAARAALALPADAPARPVAPRGASRRGGRRRPRAPATARRQRLPALAG